METLSHENEKSKASFPLILLMICAFCDQTIVEYLVVAVGRFPIISAVQFLVKPVLYGVLIFLVYLYSNNEKGSVYLSYILVPGFFVIAILLTGLIYPDNWQYIEEVFSADILPCLPFFVLGILCRPEKEVLHWIGRASCLAIVINAIYVLGFNLEDLSDDNMYRSYLLLPNVLFSIWYAFDTKKLLPWLFAGIGIVYILAMGTRGPVVILGVYLVLQYLLLGEKRSLRKTISVLIVSAVLIAFYQSDAFYDLMEAIAELLGSMNLSTRVIDSVIAGEFAESVSRGKIYETVSEKILEQPIFGYGIYGEWCWGFRTAHNIYLELLVHFGVPVGLALLFGGIWLIVRVFVKNTNYYAKSLILIWATFVLVQGIFGGSYLRYGVFFLLGFCLKESHSENMLPKEPNTTALATGGEND